MRGDDLMNAGIRLAELASQAGAELRGDADCVVTHVDTIQDAGPGAICFLANAKYRKYLTETRATAVILGREDAGDCQINHLVCDNPYLVYARVATLLNPMAGVKAEVHPSAVVADDAEIAPDAHVGPNAVVEGGTVIESGAFVGPGCVIGRDCFIGANSRLVARVTLCHETRIGERVLIHPGAVIGSDGFGLANDEGVWKKVPQLGKVRIGDDVEIGANTTIDRGALRDTVLEEGVKLDNQIQIAHNVHIGKHTAIAGCAAVAGSTSIGSHCTIGGGVGIVGHLEIADNTHISAQTLVTRSLKEPGYYSGNLPAVPNREWRKTIARVRHIDDMMNRLKDLEKHK